MGKWIRLIGTGLLGFLGACRPFGSQLLPDSQYSIAKFTPDGGRILVDSHPSGQVYLYDLAAKKVLWTLPARPLAGVSFSPRGKFAVFVEQNQRDSSAQLSVIRLADGVKSEFKRSLGKYNDISDSYYRDYAAKVTAVSDDGAWVILAYMNAPLEVYATADGRLLYQGEKQGTVVAQVSIEPGDKRVAVLAYTAAGQRVEMLTPSQGSWSATVLETYAMRQTWTSAGLGLVTSRGIELWNGGEPRLAVPLTQSKGTHDVYAAYYTGEPCIDVSPDGAFAAVSTYNRFDVFDLKRGSKIFSHGEEHASMKETDPGLLSRAEFTGQHLRAFLRTGDFVDVDLSIPQIVKTISFGSSGQYSKNWFSDGSSWESNYQPIFGPSGRYIDIYQEESGHKIYPLP